MTSLGRIGPRAALTLLLAVVASGQIVFPPQITSDPPPVATVGTPYFFTFKATNGMTPYTWSSTPLPSWLTLNSSSGVLSGTR